MIIPVGYGQVTHVFEGGGLPFGAVCTYGIENQIPAFAEIIASNCHDHFVAEILPRLPSEITLAETRVKLGPNATGAAAVAGDPETGSTTGPVASSQVSWLVRKRSSLGGRQGRGRMFLPGVRESEIGSDGAVSSADVLAWNLALLDFQTLLDGNGTPMVILHSDSLTPTPVTSLTLDSTIATQRRRLRR